MDHNQKRHQDTSSNDPIDNWASFQRPKTYHSESKIRSNHGSDNQPRIASFPGLQGLEKSTAPHDRKSQHPQVSNSSTTRPSSSRPSSTRGKSQPPSVRSRGSFSSMKSTMTDAELGEIRHEVMVNYLYQQQCANLWVAEGAGETEGCILRKDKGGYTSYPDTLQNSQLLRSMKHLNVQSAMTINSRVIKTYMQRAPEGSEIPLKNGLNIQLAPSMEALSWCNEAQCAAFVITEGLLVVWEDDPLDLIERAKTIESQLMDLIWSVNDVDVKEEQDALAERRPRVVPVAWDEETGQITTPRRPVHIMNSMLVSLTIFVVEVAVGVAMREIVKQVYIDGYWPRCVLAALVPITVFFTLFFVQVLFGSIAQMFGPIRQLDTNSRYYSACRPAQLQTSQLPDITIQCPVYKEGLQGVIAPTIRSLKRAMAFYELQGSTCNLFVNDDGLRLMDGQEREARIQFYADYNIGWTARPAHGDNGFQRRGKFKKASNMNFGLRAACQIEKKLARIPHWKQHSTSQRSMAYWNALHEVRKESGGLIWTDGDIRIGDYILIVDSDTRVPEDAFLDAVSEMEQSPEVAILQFSSGVMQVTNTYFENGITFFTNLIYSAIRYTVANGDVAPFVGHNALLRWSALKSVSFVDEDGFEKFWSESHVSEDFDMSLRLQCVGYIIRLAAWAGGGFKEGVSLTVYDELARWEKYAYGCNELMFHPIRKWCVYGPFTPTFLRFLRSGIPVASKITVISYIGTYYAIGAAWILTVANYFLKGWYGIYLDQYYVDSWQVWFTILIVFTGLGNIGLAVMRYRIKEKKLVPALLENFKWVVLLAIFLGGLSIHVSGAILAHMFEIDMSWGATAKELEHSNFFSEAPKIFKKFKWSLLFSLTAIVVMIVLAVAPSIPWWWRITDFVAILPMATVAVSHLLLPLALNPALMEFSF